eukprot:TRINITY_DN1628_c0_g1_i1.p2 TRINITY_DN1628_c0_g1~~TRINITY_DN1628_c0_g1_i1.p2  ORF type:complete len:306 (+),score=49.94 TRINITY_DN1628_c0_g1_i1:34-951(+)
MRPLSLALLFLCIVVACAVLVSADEFYENRVGAMLSGLADHVDLDCDERLFTHGQGPAPAWISSTFQLDVDRLKPWGKETSPHYPSTMLTFYDIYKSWLMPSVRSTQNDSNNCLLSAYNVLGQFNRTKTPLFYYPSLYPSDWEVNYDKGLYRKPVVFNRTFGDGKGGQAHLSFDGANATLLRVDVQPREWYLPALPYLLKDARIHPNGPCGKLRNTWDCFFAEGAYMSAITTGMVVMSDYRTRLQFPGGNATSTSQPAVPYIVAWIIKRMPVRNSFCPCYTQDPRFGNGCTKPWEYNPSSTVLGK